MMYFVRIGRNGRASEYELAFSVSVVNLKACRIPQLWSKLPFVYQAWCRTCKKFLR